MIVRNVFRQFFKYGITGLLSLGLEVVSYAILTELVSLWYVLASAASATLGFVLSLVLNRQWTFHSKGNLLLQTTLMGVLFVFNLVASSALVYALTEGLGLFHFLSKIITIGLIALWNFPLYRKVVFR